MISSYFISKPKLGYEASLDGRHPSNISYRYIFFIKMNKIIELIDWAEKRGVQLDGIEPALLPGRGIGIVASRRIEVSG